MIVCDHFVYIHTSRHGGTFINRCLLNCIPGAVQLRYHGRLSDLPEQYRHLPVIGFVRNPWDWYTSMFFNYRQKDQYVFRVLSDRGRLDFSETLSRFLRLGDGSELSRALLHHLQAIAPATLGPDVPKRFRNPGLTKADFRDYPQGIGYYTWLLTRMHGVHGKTVGNFGRFENLRRDLLSMLRETNVLVSDQLLDYLSSHEPLNQSQRDRDFRVYFDEALVSEIQEMDRTIIRQFGYEFSTDAKPIPSGQSEP